jgi:predicted nuclease of predicted toxin-antitoxin system
MIRLYFDEDSMRRSLVRALRARGVDVITALDAGMVEREDAEHLDYATEQGRVLCSFNVGDFYRLHSEYVAQGKPHAGIILMRQQYYSVGEQMRRLLKLMASKSADEMKDWVEFLSAWGRVSG